MSEPLKHTPGPWALNSGLDIAAGSAVVAKFWTRPSPQDEALILAAPELLESLKLCRTILDNVCVELNGSKASGTTIRNIDAVIAKAEGGQPA